jgi:hypothetical protein
MRSWGNRLGRRTQIRMRSQVQVLAGPPAIPASASYACYSRSVTVLGMASPLRRALRWLGFTQPYSRVGRGTPFFGTPFRPSYVCPTCGALVATSAHERHIDWHVKIGG